MDKQELLSLAKQNYREVEAILVELARIPSTTPPSDTRAIVDYVHSLMKRQPAVETQILTEEPPICNLLAVVKSQKPGKRLLLNGHLDTFEVVTPEQWQHDPFGGEVVDRRVYGVGVSDMKAGCASLIVTFLLLAAHRSEWEGEVVLSLVGGEEAGGKHGTGFLLRTRDEMQADACLIADVGSPRVMRFGEKGRYRFKLSSRGIPGHGAHAHKTLNANELLIDAIIDFRSSVNQLELKCPQKVIDLIKMAQPVSEPIAGKGETHTLLHPTINIGILKGGTAPNLVPEYAEAIIDTRIPVGISPEEIEDILDGICQRHPHVTYLKQMAFDALCSDVECPLLEILRKNAELSFNAPCAATVRVGGTDAKHIRQYGIPAFVCGVEGGKMGAPDEYVDFDELDHLLDIHVLSAFEYLGTS